MTARATAPGLLAVIIAAVSATCASASQNATSSSQQEGFTLPGIVVFVKPEDVFSPPSKAKYCSYSGEMIRNCEFGLFAWKTHASMAETIAKHAALRKRLAARENKCVNRAMTGQQVRAGWFCLRSVTDCSGLPYCVFDDEYRGDPAEKLELRLFLPGVDPTPDETR